MNKKIFKKGYRYKPIKTKRLLLIKPSIKYAEEQYKIYKDKKTHEYNGAYKKITFKENIERIKKKQKKWRKQEGVSFMVIYNNELIGLVGTYQESAENRNCSIGYFITSKYWNYGFMSEVLSAFVKFVFKNTIFHKISAEVCTKNKPSIKVLEKNKFKKEGHLRKSCIFNNIVYDNYIYSIIDYKKIKKMNEKPFSYE